MDRLTNSTGRAKHLEQNLNRLVVDTSNNKSTSISQNQSSPPILRNNAEKNGIKLYPFIQQSEYKYKKTINSTDSHRSSLVESSSSSDEDVGFKKAPSEITLSSRPTSTQKKNMFLPFVESPSNFFERMPEDVIKKILFDKQLIDLNNIPVTAKNLRAFAGVSKFNREFARQLLTEDEMQEVSFEITKSVIPNLLATLANDKKSKFTQADLDSLVHNYPYLTLDCSYVIDVKNFINQGLQVLNKIVCHPGLKEIRIISNPSCIGSQRIDKYLAYNNIVLELIYSLLSRESSDPLKVDLIFNNCQPPVDSKFKIDKNSFELIEKIQNRADKCESVIFGNLDLRNRKYIFMDRSDVINRLNTIHNLEYQFKYVKMMCNIALTHSAHTISLVDLKLFDIELGLILHEINLCNKSSLQNLYLHKNDLDESAFDSLSVLLQSENTSLKTLKIFGGYIFDKSLDILEEALKNNHSLELIEIKTLKYKRDHPIRNDKRVRITKSS